MSRDLHEKIGSVIPENLFAGLEPRALTKAGVLRKLGAAATIKRGTLLGKNSAGKLVVFGSDVDDTGTWSGTGNGSTTVFSLISGGTVPSSLDEVKVDGTALTTGWAYYPETGNLVFDTAPANSKTIAVKFTIAGSAPDCVLSEDVDVGTDDDEPALVYISGNFNEDELIMASGASLTEADRDALRVRGILLGASETESVTA